MKFKNSWKGFGGLSLIIVFSFLSFFWIKNQENEGGIPWLLRANHELNEKIWSLLYRESAAPPKKSAQKGDPIRVNGKLGLTDDIDIEKWRVHIFAEGDLVQTLSLDEIKELPRTETSTEFYCIEGWSSYFSYSGVRFSDFMKALKLESHYRYVNFQTPDSKYYVSIDMRSMLHDHTLLAYEMNEEPLLPENGAPLRLVIPIKYGIKSLKRIGQIQLSNTKGPDYWAERGYDWYSGL